MGLFSSETVTTVGTSIVRLIADDTVDKAAKTALIQSMFNGTDMVDAVLESSMSNMAIKSNRFYKEAERSYVFGLPKGVKYTNTLGLNESQQLLSNTEGVDVLIRYHRFGNLNCIHWGWQELIKSYGYNTVTNELRVKSLEHKKPVFLKDMQVVIPQNKKSVYPPEVTSNWGKPANSGKIPGRRIDLGDYSEFYYVESPVEYHYDTSFNPRLRITYTWLEVPYVFSWGDDSNYSPPPTFPEVVFEIDLPNLDPAQHYFQTCYSLNEVLEDGSTVTVYKYWQYLKGSGDHPILDALNNTGDTRTGTYFPNLYFRLNKRMLNDTGGDSTRNNQLASLKKVAKKIEIDVDKVTEDIATNADVGQVEQALMVFGIPADTTNKKELQYLFDFFSHLHQINGGGISSANDLYLRAFANDSNFISDVIEVSDLGLRMALQHGGVTKERKVGVIGSKGTLEYGTGFNRKSREVVYTWNDSLESTVINWDIPYRYYRKQVGLNLYDEIRVYNLSMRYMVWGDYHTTIGDDSKELMLVPLDKSITDTYSNKDNEELFQRSMHFVFNSRESRKVKWYQQDWFGDLLKVGAIVLTIASGFSEGGFLLEAASAVTASAYAVAAAIILTEIAITYIVKVAFTLFVKMVGVDVAFIASLIAAAYGLGDQLSSGATKLTATAKEMLFVASGLAAGVNENTKEMLEDLLKDYKEFALLKEEKADTLQSAEKLLESNSLLTPLMIVGESPTDFYNRTTHLGNVGRLLLDDVHNFVDRSLQLPKFSNFD